MADKAPSLAVASGGGAGLDCPVHPGTELLFTREGQPFEYLICPLCVSIASPAKGGESA